MGTPIKKVHLRASCASGEKDWIATAYPDRLVLEFGVVGHKLKTMEISTGQSLDALYERMHKKLNEGYTHLTVPTGTPVTVQARAMPIEPAFATPGEKAPVRVNWAALDDSGLDW